MKLKFHRAKESLLTASIHKTGHLCFCKELSEEIGINEGYYFDICTDEEDYNNYLYLMPYTEKEQGAMKVFLMAGANFAIRAKKVFDMLKIDYSNGVTYEATEEDYEGVIIYKLTLL